MTDEPNNVELVGCSADEVIESSLYADNNQSETIDYQVVMPDTVEAGS